MASRYLARYASPPPAAFLKAQADISALTFRSLLTYPCPDLAGDYVVPSGCDFTPHQSDPGIDLEHGRHPDVRTMPVAWARASLSEPGAPYAVEMCRLNFADDGQPADYHTVPVGTEYFDRSCPVSMQVFALREQGVLPASSIEFALVPGFYKSIGWSALEGRNAYRIDRASVHRWTICARGVNPGALTLEKSASARTQVPLLLGKILTDKRVNVGGKWEPLHGHILKALAPLAEAPKRTTVRVEQKAMEPDAELQTQGDQMVEDATPADTGASGPTPTAAAAYDLAQGAKDLCDQITAAAKAGEHKPGRKKLMALCEKLDTIAEMAMGVGKQVDADLSDDGELDGSDDEGEDAEAAETPEPEVTDDDMESDDEDGVLKGIPPTYKKAVKRFKLTGDGSIVPVTTEIKKAAESDADSPADIAFLEEQKARFARKLRICA